MSVHPFALLGMAKICADNRVDVSPSGVLCHDAEDFWAAAELAQAAPEKEDGLTSGLRQAYRFAFDGVRFTAFLTYEEAAEL